MGRNDRLTVSVVVSAYDEESVIDELCRRLRGVFDAQPGYEFEAILVDNGSLDATWAEIVKARQLDERFLGVQLARNFGTDGGLTAGLEYARGDAAITMCADLQDPPELIAEFIKFWEQGYENVYGIVTKRRGTGILRRTNSQLFYRVMHALTGGAFPKNVSDFRLVDRKVYETVRGMREHNRFLRGMFFWTGFKSIGVEHERPPRFAGRSKASTLYVLELAVRSILAYSYLPLRFITVVGLVVSVFSFGSLLATVVRVLVWGVPFPGFGTILSVILLMFGFLFTMLGVVAEYVGLIYEEVKGRPNFVVRQTLGR